MPSQRSSVGSEMRSGHLSYFASSSTEDAVELLSEAVRLAGLAGDPALFVSVAADDHARLADAWGRSDTVLAPATVYGGGLDDGADWNINSSEI